MRCIVLQQWVGKVMAGIKGALRTARSPAARQRRRVLLELQQLERRDCPSGPDTWIGPDGGNWNTAAYWSTGNVPINTTLVVFDGDYSQGRCYYTGGNYSPICASIAMKSNYTGQLHFQQQSGGVNIGPAGLELDGGGIEQDSGQPINCGGDFNWTGGNLNDLTGLLAEFNMAPTTNLSISQATSKKLGSDINLVGDTGVISMPTRTAKLTFEVTVHGPSVTAVQAASHQG
jgi:hypothetical protein